MYAKVKRGEREREPHASFLHVYFTFAVLDNRLKILEHQFTMHLSRMYKFTLRCFGD